jgi:hypothetical protein
MHQYNMGAPFERIAIDVTESFPTNSQGNPYLQVTMDYFTKWPEVYPIPNKEELTVAVALVTNFFCRFGLPREIHNDQGRYLESHLLQGILHRLEVSKTPNMSLHPQSEGMVERHIMTVGEHLRNVVTSHQRDWD